MTSLPVPSLFSSPLPPAPLPPPPLSSWRGPAWPLRRCLLCAAFNFREVRLTISPSPPRGRAGALWLARGGPGLVRMDRGLGRRARVFHQAVRRIPSTVLTDGLGLLGSEAHTARCCGVLGSLALVPQPHVSRLFGLRRPFAGSRRSPRGP